jgi:anti-sigma factor (TIGR02949 family)
MSEGALRCEEALRLLAAYLDGELENADQFDLERHLETCRSCYSRAEFERHLKAQIRELKAREPQPEFVDRIRRLIRRFDGETKPVKP